MQLIQPSDSLPSFLHTLFFSKVSITTRDYRPLLSFVDLQTILLQTHAYRTRTCDCGQVNHPARQSALGTGSPTSRCSPPSRRCRLVHINAIKVLPARGVACAARSPARAARSARSVPLHCGPRPRTLRPACRAARATLIAFTPSESASHSAPAPFNMRPPTPCPTSAPQAANVCRLICAQPLASKVSLPFRTYRRPAYRRRAGARHCKHEVLIFETALG